MLFLNPKVLMKEPGGESSVNHLTVSAMCLHTCAVDHWRSSWHCQSQNLSKHLSLSGPPPFPPENEADNTSIHSLAIWEFLWGSE